jgi:hypothetical protein
LLFEGDDVLPIVKRMWVEWHDRYFDSKSWERTKGVDELTNSLRTFGVEVHVWR